MSSFDAGTVQEHLFALAHKVIPVLDKMLDRNGGALHIIALHEGINHSEVVGFPSIDKRGIYTDNARRKVVELTIQIFVASTASIADPEGDPPLYGGGIRCSNGWIIAFSGYPPEWDEALCIALAKHFNLLSEEDELRIVQFYQNQKRVSEVEEMIAYVLR